MASKTQVERALHSAPDDARSVMSFRQAQDGEEGTGFSVPQQVQL